MIFELCCDQFTGKIKIFLLLSYIIFKMLLWFSSNRGIYALSVCAWQEDFIYLPLIQYAGASLWNTIIKGCNLISSTPMVRNSPIVEQFPMPALITQTASAPGPGEYIWLCAYACLSSWCSGTTSEQLGSKLSQSLKWLAFQWFEMVMLQSKNNTWSRKNYSQLKFVKK